MLKNVHTPITVQKLNTGTHTHSTHTNKHMNINTHTPFIRKILNTKYLHVEIFAHGHFPIYGCEVCICIRIQYTCYCYLITCRKCGIQYVGEMGQSLRKRMNNHRNRLKKLSCQYLYQHFNSDGHTDDDISIVPIY